MKQRLFYMTSIQRPVPYSWPHHGNRASGLINDVGAGEMDEERRFRPKA